MTAPPEKPRQLSDEAANLRVAEINRVLVGGDGRPANPVAATTLFRGAVNQGNGAAAERLAALAARGVNRDANWTEAVGWLVKAADLGNAAAQGQILALLEVDGAAPGATWLELGRQIDLAGLLGVPSLTRLRESPAIALIEGLATPGMCRWLMGRCAEQLTAGLGLGDMDVVSVLAQKRLELASGLKVIQQEPPRLLSYGAGEADEEGVDFPVSSGLEVESSIATKGRRVATCLTWLNDDFEGGEAAFPRIDWRYAGRPGDSLLFLNVRSGDREPDPLSLHADMPVTQGRKWVLSQSVRDSAQPIA